MILILMIIILPVIAALFSRFPGISSSKNTFNSKCSQKDIKNEPSKSGIFSPDTPSNKQQPQTSTLPVKDPLSDNIPDISSADSITLRETLQKSSDKSLDVPANTTKPINNSIETSHIWSEGLTRAAKKHDEKIRVKEQAAPANATKKHDNEFNIIVRRSRAFTTSLLIAPKLGWLDLPKLAVSRGITHSYSIGYSFKDMKHDMWTSRFNNFKYGETDAIKGASAVLQYAVFHLIKMRFSSINPDKILFMPALSSEEEKVDPERPICQITQRCAAICGASYSDTVLSKKAHRPIHKLSSAQERQNELNQAQYKSEAIEEEHIFIFDDIITKGNTLSHIACAILEKNPHCKVYGIALAKAESLSYHPYLNNNIIPERWNTEWENNSYIPS